ncbi:MAG: TfoX/Sxy family protein [Candidatus Falkowbacteria bacterium]|nr:TfoX/Sxy family protein [Candidatus Falkowbacteria bacterium]
MATKQATIDFILDQLLGLDKIATRKMFGEYALYYQNKVVALVCNDTLFVKITAAGRDFAGEYYEEGFAYPGAKASLLIDEDRIECGDWLSELIEITYNNLPEAKIKKNKKYEIKD